MPLRPLAPALALALCLLGSAALPADRLKSPECLAALGQLDAREAALLASRPASASHAPGPGPADGALAAARQAAARACLGAQAGLPAARRPGPPPAWRAPAATPPPSAGPAGAAPVATPTRPPLQALPPPSLVPAPRTVTSCSLAGCWTDDGTHLPRAGDNLLAGPRGPCSVQGSVLLCP